MRFLAFCLLVLFAFPPTSLAYPQDQLQQCILSSKQSPIILGTPEKSIADFCDCSLKLIVDERQEGEISVNECAVKYFK